MLWSQIIVSNTLFYSRFFIDNFSASIDSLVKQPAIERVGNCSANCCRTGVFCLLNCPVCKRSNQQNYGFDALLLLFMQSLTIFRVKARLNHRFYFEPVQNQCKDS